MSSFRISTPAATLLRSAGLEPAQLNAILDRKATRREEMLLRPGHPYPVLVRERTKVPLMMIARRRCRILIEIESPFPFLRYVERSGTDCQLLMRAAIPETVVLALPGERVGTIIGGMPYLSDVPIRTASLVGGVVELLVEPEWQRIT